MTFLRDGNISVPNAPSSLTHFMMTMQIKLRLSRLHGRVGNYASGNNQGT